MKTVARFLFAALLWSTASTALLAQSSPNLIYGQVPTAAQWNSYFAHKQDVLGFTPVNKAGDVMTGRLVTAGPTISAAGFNLPQGTAPLTPTNGDLWTTSVGLYVRINGATVGPLVSAASCTTCAFTNAANVFTAVQTVNLNTTALPSPLTGTLLNLGGVDATVARLQINAFGAQAFVSIVAYGGTNAVPTAVTSGTQVGGFNAHAYNGTAIVGPIASFRIYAAQSLAVGAQGSRACVGTTPIGSTTIGDSLCQYANGFVNVSVTAPTSVPDALLTINGNTGTSAALPFTASIHIVGPAGDLSLAFFDSYGNQTGVIGRRANGSRITPTTLIVNDLLFNLAVIGFDGSAYPSSGNAALSFFAANTWSLSDHSTYAELRTTAIGATTVNSPGTGVRFNPSGSLSIGNASDQGNGTLNLTAGLYNNGTAPVGTGGYVRAASAVTTIDGVACTLGSSCTLTAAASSITVGTTTVLSGVTGRPLYDNGFVLGEYVSIPVAFGGTNCTAASGTCLDNITGFATTGVLVRTASGTYAFRAITGTASRTTITNGDGVSGAPTIDISASYVGQTTITTLGTITTGVWNGTVITGTYGGTGVNNGASTITIAASLTHAGAFATTITVTAITNSTLPSGTHTLAGLDVVQSWTANQTFSSGNFLLAGSSSGNLTIKPAAAAGSNTLTFPAGTTDFSATGGTSQVVKQTGAGGAFTVARLACSDLSDSSTGCSAASGITALTGDGTATGPGSVAFTLTTVNSTVGTFGNALQTPIVTVNGKGLVTNVTTATITPAISNVTGIVPACVTWLVTSSSVNLAACMPDESGSGPLIFANNASMDTPTFTTRMNSTGNAFFGPTLSTPDALVTINANATASAAPTFTTQFHMVGADATLNVIFMDALGSQNLFYARRANGTNASKTALAANDVIFNFGGVGYDSSGAYIGAANVAITLNAAAAWTASDHSTFIDLRTTTPGSAITGPGGGLRVNPTGCVSVGAANDCGVGNIVVSGHLLASGAASAPTNSSCGTSPTVGGSDTFGNVTGGTGVLTSCVINFGKTWGATPKCTASSPTLSALTVTATTTQLTIGGTSLTGVVLNWICGSTARLEFPANDNHASAWFSNRSVA